MQNIESFDDSALAKKRSGNRTGMKNIDKWKKDVLMRWVIENKNDPYPSEDVKEGLAKSLDLTKKQVSNWFTNARKVSTIFTHFYYVILNAIGQVPPLLCYLK